MTRLAPLVLKSLFLIILTSVSLNGFSQDSVAVTKSEFDDWKFRLGPYFWFINIKGSLERPPVPSTLPEPQLTFDVDLSFREINNLLKFAFLLNGVYQGNKWVASLNTTSFILEGDALTPKNVLLQDVNYRLSTVMSEALAGYRVLKKPKFNINVLAGAKLIYFNIQGESKIGGFIPISGNRDILWIEPIIAANFVYKPFKRWEIMTYVDYGPIRDQKELTAQGLISINYLVNKWLYISPGYRYWYFRTEQTENIFNGQFYGAYIKLGFQF
jgi:hypothetical protein